MDWFVKRFNRGEGVVCIVFVCVIGVFSRKAIVVIVVWVVVILFEGVVVILFRFFYYMVFITILC